MHHNNKVLLRKTTLIIAMLAVNTGSVLAQENDTSEQENDTIIEEVIVTGVSRPTTKFESTMSVTSIPADDVVDFAPRSTAEIFRNIPGIQAESSSGDANANIKVRGMPISSGGARYISLQEDGFPMMLVGDTAFSTADSFLRFDPTVSSIQSIRGGSSSTQAANAPGGIINFISKTGGDEAGSIALTVGLDYNSKRLDSEYGGTFGNDWDYHVGGFLRSGEGPRDSNGVDAEKGFQIKSTISKDFDRGSIKFHIKHLDDKAPTYLPIPALYTGSGFSELGTNFDSGTLYLNITDYAPRRNGIQAVNGEGFESKMTSFGVSGDYEIADNWIVAAKYRTASIKGNFASPFPANTITFSDGSLGSEIVYFNTQINDVGNDFGDINITADYDTIQATAGLTYANQKISTTWNFNQYYRALDGNLTTFENGDSVGGVLYGNPAFGNCCTRAYDFDIDGLAPYLTLSGNIGEFATWDFSYRKDNYNVKGSFQESTVLVPLDVNGNGVIDLNEQAVPTLGDARRADYDVDYNSFSLGVNFPVSDSTALFVNISEGGSLSSPDRVTGNIRADGSIENSSGFSEVSQQEIGVKFHGDNASIYVTLFNAEISEAREFEVSTQAFLENAYESSGLEIEGDFDINSNFGIKGSATFTDAEIVKTASGDNIGNQPRRQANYIFNITPYYTSDNWDIGLNFVGTDEVYVQDSNDLKFDAYITTNLFFNYMIRDNVSLSLNANNLFNEVGFTEGEEGNPAAGSVVRIRPINGRTTSVSIRYDF